MEEWKFWDKEDHHRIYQDMYRRTAPDDWNKVVSTLAKLLNESQSKRSFLDVGCGEGHTTKQILDQVRGDFVCDVLEPSKKALVAAKKRLTNKHVIGRYIHASLQDAQLTKKYDIIFSSHANYYWAREPEEYHALLEKLYTALLPGGTLAILSLPMKSGHYRIMTREGVYPDHAKAEYLKHFFVQKGCRVKIKKFCVRLFVKDILEAVSQDEMIIFFQFIHGSTRIPKPSELSWFMEKIKKVQRRGWIDFCDWLVKIQKR